MAKQSTVFMASFGTDGYDSHVEILGIYSTYAKAEQACRDRLQSSGNKKKLNDYVPEEHRVDNEYCVRYWRWVVDGEFEDCDVTEMKIQ